MSNSASPDSRVATTRPEHRRGMTRSQIREERRRRSHRRQRRKRTVLIAFGSVFAVIIIFALVFQQGFVSQEQPLGGERGNYNPGGPAPEDPDDGRAHIFEGVAPETPYSVFPPTSGPHWNTLGNAVTDFEAAPTGWGPYGRFLPDQVLIHNLEHGGIGMHFDPTKCAQDQCAEFVDQLSEIAKDWTEDDTYRGFVISPYPNMETPITITAWRHHLAFDDVDTPRIIEFIDAYYDRGFEPQVAGMTSSR